MHIRYSTRVSDHPHQTIGWRMAIEQISLRPLRGQRPSLADLVGSPLTKLFAARPGVAQYQLYNESHMLAAQIA